MNQIKLKNTISYILDNIDESRKVKNCAFSIRKKLVDLTLEEQVISEQEFYRISSVLSPQSRSPLWEKYFIKKHDCEKVSKDEDRGDFKKNGTYYEYKSSGYNDRTDESPEDLAKTLLATPTKKKSEWRYLKKLNKNKD